MTMGKRLAIFDAMDTMLLPRSSLPCDGTTCRAAVASTTAVSPIQSGANFDGCFDTRCSVAFSRDFNLAIEPFCLLHFPT